MMCHAWVCDEDTVEQAGLYGVKNVAPLFRRVCQIAKGDYQLR
jgi:hypothetical protein